MLARVLSSSGTILRYPLPHNSGSPVRVAHHLPHNSPKMSICRPHLGCTFVVVLSAQPRIIRVDITYLDNLDFPAPVEEFPVTLAPQFAPDPSTEVTPGFNHRNHLSSLFAQGSSAWLGLALQHPAVPELTQGRVAELFSLLLHRHDALRWAVFLPSSQQPPFSRRQPIPFMPSPHRQWTSSRERTARLSSWKASSPSGVARWVPRALFAPAVETSSCCALITCTWT